MDKIDYYIALNDIDDVILTDEQLELESAVNKLCEVDNIHVKTCDLTYFMVECDRLNMNRLKQDIVDKSVQISIDLFNNI